MNTLFLDTALSIEQIISLEQKFGEKVQLIVKRDDLIHPEISGNKWRKLKYNLENALHLKKEGVLTFGGAYSNHLLATASACNLFGLKSIGIVRGEELNENSNSNLKKCKELGMELIFVSRGKYAERNYKEAQEEWKEKYPEFLFVPEGGANFYGIVGCQEIIKELSFVPDHVFVSFGTGTTAAGILSALNANTHLHIVSSLKGYEVEQELKRLLYLFYMDKDVVEEIVSKISIHSNYHFGGYGKVTEELLKFKDEINKKYELPLDKVYTAKTFYCLRDWLDENAMKFTSSQKILFIHTGGLSNN